MPSHLKRKTLFGIHEPGYRRERSSPTTPTQDIREEHQNRATVELDVQYRDNVPSPMLNTTCDQFKDSVIPSPFMNSPYSDDDALKNVTLEEDQQFHISAQRSRIDAAPASTNTHIRLYWMLYT